MISKSLKKFEFPFVTILTVIIMTGCGMDSVEKKPSSTRVQPLTFSPLTYFDSQCSRCHGPNGAHYGDDFGKGLSEKKLRTIVDDMAAGPGEAPLEGAELAAQVAFHHSLIVKTPFIVLTKLETNGMRGEVMPGSEVILEVDGKSFAAEVDGRDWSISLPENSLDDPAKDAPILIARREGSETRLDLSRNSYSHSGTVN